MDASSYRTLFSVWRAGEMATRVRLYVHPATPGQEMEEIRAWTDRSVSGFGDQILQLTRHRRDRSMGLLQRRWH